jgi:hypothetical protein
MVPHRQINLLGCYLHRSGDQRNPLIRRDGLNYPNFSQRTSGWWGLGRRCALRVRSSCVVTTDNRIDIELLHDSIDRRSSLLLLHRSLMFLRNDLSLRACTVQPKISTGNVVLFWKDLAMTWTSIARTIPTGYIDGFRGSGGNLATEKTGCPFECPVEMRPVPPFLWSRRLDSILDGVTPPEPKTPCRLRPVTSIIPDA